jgi:hypothetical protein
MKNEIKEYLAEAEIRIKGREDLDEAFLEEMLTRIGFYQHERLVHLIVTMTFAIMTVISFFMLITAPSLPALLLALLFLGLTIPYIYHYYFLENSTQKLYKLYYEALSAADARERE